MVTCDYDKHKHSYFKMSRMKRKPIDNPPVKRGRGRPKIQLDYELIEDLAKIHCTQEEIASILGCSVDTLQKDPKFYGIYTKGKDEGRKSLRRQQWDAVYKGNVAMMIWLGKQLLGQRDVMRNEISGPDNTPIKTEARLDLSILSDDELALAEKLGVKK